MYLYLARGVGVGVDKMAVGVKLAIDKEKINNYNFRQILIKFEVMSQSPSSFYWRLMKKNY